MKLTIIGASGHGKVVSDIAEKNGYDEIEFLDDNEKIITCGRWPVVGRLASLEEIDNDVFIAIGNANTRHHLMEQHKNKNFPVLIHPNAVIAPDVEIGSGTVVMAGAVVNSGVRLGTGVIINTCSSVDHDCIIEDYVHISVGSHLSGTIKVGSETWIGVGVSIVNNINICSHCFIGAGAVVVRDINEKGTYYGVPAKKKGQIS